jgi:hypothetical protein
MLKAKLGRMADERLLGLGVRGGDSRQAATIAASHMLNLVPPPNEAILLSSAYPAKWLLVCPLQLTSTPRRLRRTVAADGLDLFLRQFGRGG